MLIVTVLAKYLGTSVAQLKETTTGFCLASKVISNLCTCVGSLWISGVVSSIATSFLHVVAVNL